eukprot:TRINITY_DN13292_c0_g3_i2.p1 TRINITY_DN13292_c0_g3~~TRINITY_DN13292_c0_g3_i2.p1  ORF type:complete len:614 (+),score=131.72 TRINITY_DN13292_c0_g3_i2:46-1887(+)
MAAKSRLYELVAPRPYLNESQHHLHDSYVRAQEAIDVGGDADDLIDRLAKEIEAEQVALKHAFKLFDNSKSNLLSKADVKNMNRYLGFPAEDSDVDELLKLVDTDKSGSISLDEFEKYVGWMGGSAQLFRQRHERIGERCGRVDSIGSAADLEDLSGKLQLAGIDREAQAYWKMVVPETELQAVAELVRCQSDAVATIRRLAKMNHQKALPKLQERIASMGFPDDQLWLTLAWIRELAPVIVHVNLDKSLAYMEKDGYYRNQFETGSSGGLLKPEIRKKWERDLFSGKYDSASGFERPKYGVQNVMNDYRGVVACKQYGDSYIILRDARLRCTFSPEDSANLKAEKLAVLDFYAHVLAEYSDAELKETLKVANSADAALLGDSERVGKMKYKEAQIHGEVNFARHVERLVAHTRHRDAGQEARLKALCSKYGWGFSWMDQERERMRAESMHKLGGAAWQSRLEALQEGGGDIEVPEGFCKVGCGKRVSPGVTRSGKPFTTCCRGCVMGFGHDRMCGRVDAAKVGPGLCKLGCGRKVAQGRDGKGRAFTTCCRGCAKGMDHDRTCGACAEVPAGMCKHLCGRKAAPGTTPSGRPFDTCCRDCARGAGHSASCIP